jgi:transposase-like protein
METIRAFLPYLSRQLPFLRASEALGLSRVRVAGWTCKFQAWLLKLDPSGHWEGKVRLGVEAREPRLTCPRCGHHGAMSFRGVGFCAPTPNLAVTRGRKMRCHACGRHFMHRDIEGRRHRWLR